MSIVLDLLHSPLLAIIKIFTITYCIHAFIQFRALKVLYTHISTFSAVISINRTKSKQQSANFYN